MGGKSRRPRFVFTKRTPDRAACGRRFYKTNPLVRFPAVRGRGSGHKTKPRWAGSRATPDSLSQDEPPTVWRAEGGFTIRTRSSCFRRCAVAVRLQTPQRHEVGALQGKPAASGTIRQMQFSPRLMLPRFLRSRFSEYVPTTMELDPVIADRLSLRDGSY